MKKDMWIKKIFWILVIMFVVLISFIFIPFNNELKRVLFPFVAMFGFAFCILGLILFFKIKRVKFKDKWLRRWLMIVGISPVGVIASIILHNLISGFGVYLGYAEFEEAVFFSLGTIGFPLLFLAGVVGVLVRWRR